MIKHPSFGTLDEYLNNYLKPRIEKGLAVVAAGFTLTWFADQYRTQSKPAEPGAISPNSNQTQPNVTLADIDNIRMLFRAGKGTEAFAALEDVSAKIGR